MGKLRHVAISVPDPWKAAEFYVNALGMTKVGEGKAPAADGVYFSDGTHIQRWHPQRLGRRTQGRPAAGGIETFDTESRTKHTGL